MPAKTGYSLCERADTLQTHRILCDNTGRLWIFYHNQTRSLSFGISDDCGNSWSEAFDLMAEISGPFSVFPDEKGGIHLAVRSFHPQDIHYLELSEAKGSHKLVHQAQENQTTTYFPLIAKAQNCWHLVYGTRKYTTGAWAVVHLQQKPDDALEISKFDLPDPSFPFNKELIFLSESLYWSGDLAVDAVGCLHLVYRFFWQDGYHLFYTSLPTGQSRWNPPERLTIGEWCAGHPSLYSFQDGIYLFYRSSTNKGQIVKQVFRTGNKWTTVSAIPINHNQQILSEGLLSGSVKPTAYWVNQQGCWLLPFGSTEPD
ncbi:MAG: hypothetical protein M0T74_07810, partial [Desulfitobacterium hafniense]|nr:hypothetical protein [Desulfitobacterium hafniense]